MDAGVVASAVRSQLARAQSELSTRVEIASRALAGVTTVAVASGGRFLLSGSLDGRVALHDLARGYRSRDAHGRRLVPQSSKRAHRAGCTSATWFSSDHGAFFSVGLDNRAIIFDANRLDVAASILLPHRAHHCAISPCSSSHSLLAVGSDSTSARLVDPASCTEALTLKGHSGAVGSCAWLADDEWSLATGDDEGCIRLWDIRMPGSALVLDMNCAQAPERSRLASISERVESTAQDARAHEGGIHSLHSTRGGTLISLGRDGAVRRWDTRLARNMFVHYQGGPKSNTQLHVRGCVSDCGTAVVRTLPVRRSGAECADRCNAAAAERPPSASAGSKLHWARTRVGREWRKRQASVDARVEARRSGWCAERLLERRRRRMRPGWRAVCGGIRRR